jgi:hypothetical protein
LSSIVNRDVVPHVTPPEHVSAPEDGEDTAGPAEDVDPGQHAGGGWISGPSNPAPHRGPHTGGPDQQWVAQPARSGCNPEILIRGIEEWLTEHGYRVNTEGHNNIGRTGLAADILRTYNINPESAPMRQRGHHPNG